MENLAIIFTEASKWLPVVILLIVLVQLSHIAYIMYMYRKLSKTYKIADYISKGHHAKVGEYINLPVENRTLLTKEEKEFFRELTKQLGEEFVVFPKVSLQGFIKPSQTASAEEVDRITFFSKCFMADFLVCTAGDCTPIVAIDLMEQKDAEKGSYKRYEHICKTNFVYAAESHIIKYFLCTTDLDYEDFISRIYQECNTLSYYSPVKKKKTKDGKTPEQKIIPFNQLDLKENEIKSVRNLADNTTPFKSAKISQSGKQEAKPSKTTPSSWANAGDTQTTTSKPAAADTKQFPDNQAQAIKKSQNEPLKPLPVIKADDKKRSSVYDDEDTFDYFDNEYNYMDEDEIEDIYDIDNSSPFRK